MSRRGRPETGATLLELVLALTILVVVLGLVLPLGRADLAYIAGSFDETVARRAASSHLEAIRAGHHDLVLGEHEVDLDADRRAALPEARAERRVERVEAGLWEVRVRVSWNAPTERGRRRVELVTLVAREETP